MLLFSLFRSNPFRRLHDNGHHEIFEHASALHIYILYFIPVSAQNVSDSYPPTKTKLKLEVLLARLLDPFLGFQGFYEGKPEPTVKSAEPEVAARRKSAGTLPRTVSLSRFLLRARTHTCTYTQKCHCAVITETRLATQHRSQKNVAPPFEEEHTFLDVLS